MAEWKHGGSASEANARLIAKAPDLLEVLGELLDSLNDNGTRDVFTNTAVAASKAEVLIASIK